MIKIKKETVGCFSNYICIYKLPNIVNCSKVDIKSICSSERPLTVLQTTLTESSGSSTPPNLPFLYFVDFI